MAIVLQLESAQQCRALMMILNFLTGRWMCLHDALPMPNLMCFWDNSCLVSHAFSAIFLFNFQYLFIYLYFNDLQVHLMWNGQSMMVFLLRWVLVSYQLFSSKVKHRCGLIMLHVSTINYFLMHSLHSIIPRYNSYCTGRVSDQPSNRSIFEHV